MTLNLIDITEAFDLMDDDIHYIYDRQTQEVQLQGANDLDLDEDALLDDDDWDEADDDRYVALPSQFDIDDCQIMADFIAQLPAGEAQNALDRSIQGRGAFRFFRDTLPRFDLEDTWYHYRDEAYRTIARDWCQENNIAYHEESAK